VNDLQSIPKQARPLTERFQILVTTRKRKLSSQFAEIPLGVISEDEALELLRKLLGKLRVDRELVAAKAICEYLGYLPLAVELAGRYLQLDEDLRLSDYRQRLTIADESLDLQESEEINATRGVIAAFELSWQELSAGTAKVAMLLGLFAPADIAWDLVEEVAADLIDSGNLREGRKQLNNLYLIRAVDNERTRFAMHSLTRQFLQWKLAQDSDTNRLFRETFVMSLLGIAKQIPQSPTRDLIVEISPAIPHLDMLSREMLDDIPNPDEDENLIWAFEGIARFYNGQGFYALGEVPYQRCLISIRKILGDLHPDVVTSMSNLAGLYRSQGRYAEAEPLFLEALRLMRELSGDHHLVVALIRGNLAELFRSQGRYAEAESLYLEALRLIRELLGDRHPHVALSLNNLAELFRSQGRYAEAEPLYLEALRLIRELLGDDRHPHVALIRNNLALLYNSQGRYEDAEPLFLEALRLTQELLGNCHPYVATSINNLALLYDSQGRYEDAEPLYQQALALRQELLGDRHPDVALSLNNLAVLRYNQNRYDEAEALFLQALEIFESVLDSNHPDTQSTKNALAYLRTNQGKS